ncbi:GtrA family protein [Agromyces humatus]|uniref:GtrA/DPMS transmembrane domain-containing protein n=1 Tax=Agromyces humatus TaxID=279573 RepID=A0ABN2KNJ3_9MICO|nr:GtrA family protein [Agromyces humatus]
MSAPSGRLSRQAATFVAVGGAGWLLDVAVFNLLTATVLSSDVEGGPIVAKAISTTLAIIANWIGNRTFTFRETRRTDVVREAVEFVLVSLAGGAIAIGCLAVSHYVLGFTSRLADNIAANVVGLALGAAFRFVVYRSWVFSPRRASAEPVRSVVERAP